MKSFKKQILVFILVGMISIFLPTMVQAKAGMEIKGGTSAWTSITVSDSYDFCYELRNSDSTLGKSSGLDPHLTLNKDWAAVAYLTASGYGAASSSQTTGNKSGVMNFGSHYTQTASLCSDGTGASSYRTSLITNKDTKYVELLSTTYNAEKTRGQAFAETSGWFGGWDSYPSSSYPVGIRQGLFGFNYGLKSGSDKGTGDAYSGVTFRPVIWNMN